jgi:RNA polymerase sigma factor (sigma-70 family)
MAMAKSAEVDDPHQHPAAGMATPTRRENGASETSKVPPLAKYTRRPEVTEELRRWYQLGETAQLEEVMRIAAGEKHWTIETLVHAVRMAYAEGDRRKYFQMFNAFAKRATPLLIQQARMQKMVEKEDHAQEVLALTAKDVHAGKAEYAEAYFADYALRKGIDAGRRAERMLESNLTRVEPSVPDETDDGVVSDPVDEIADRMPSPEAQALLRHAVGKLEGKLREVFIQYHVTGLTYKEIAQQHDVDESTICNWVKRAKQLVGHQGGNDDH